MVRHLLHGFDDDLSGFDDIPSDAVTGDNPNFVSFLFHERSLETGAASAFCVQITKSFWGVLCKHSGFFDSKVMKFSQTLANAVG